MKKAGASFEYSNLFKFIAFALFVFLSANVNTDALHDATPRSKLLIMFVDGMRWDYLTDAHTHAQSGTHNHSSTRTRTPNLSRLIKQGSAQLTRIAPVYPAVCTPNLVSAFTGLYPLQHGVYSNRMLRFHGKNNHTADVVDFMHDSEALGNWLKESQKQQVRKRRFSKRIFFGKRKKQQAVEEVEADVLESFLWSRLARAEGRRTVIFSLPSCPAPRDLIQSGHIVCFGPPSHTQMHTHTNTHTPHAINAHMNELLESGMQALNHFDSGAFDLAVLYSDALDALGHRLGPQSAALRRDVIGRLDTVIGQLEAHRTRITEHHQAQHNHHPQRISLAVMSDHGMRELNTQTNDEGRGRRGGARRRGRGRRSSRHNEAGSRSTKVFPLDNFDIPAKSEHFLNEGSFMSIWPWPNKKRSIVDALQRNLNEDRVLDTQEAPPHKLNAFFNDPHPTHSVHSASVRNHLPPILVKSQPGELLLMGGDGDAISSMNSANYVEMGLARELPEYKASHTFGWHGFDARDSSEMHVPLLLIGQPTRRPFASLSSSANHSDSTRLFSVFCADLLGLNKSVCGQPITRERAQKWRKEREKFELDETKMIGDESVELLIILKESKSAAREAANQQRRLASGVSNSASPFSMFKLSSSSSSCSAILTVTMITTFLRRFTTVLF